MNKKGIIFLMTASMVAIFACQPKSSHHEQVQEHEAVAHKDAHWSYEGETSPEYWAEIEKESDCGGNSQSPINIVDMNTSQSIPEDGELKLNYKPETLLNKVLNNGHSIQFNFDEGNSITYNRKEYKLIQVHFHTPSEHTIDGVRFPIEIHLVHQSEDKELTVLGRLGKEGVESDVFEFFESFLPLQEGEEKEIHKSVGLSQLFPASMAYYFYTGSLTTPPCTEGVHWVVFKDPIILSEKEVNLLRDNMPKNNFRNEQALNGRKVFVKNPN